MNLCHGYNGTKVYRRWCHMKERCTNPHNVGWKNYGGRGVKVCKRWLKFENFLADMGEPPAGKTLDRIDSNGNYCPENCRWATIEVQSNNRRTNLLLTAFGVTKTAMLWTSDARCRVGHSTLLNRITRGWPHLKAITSPLMSYAVRRNRRRLIPQQPSPSV